MMYSIADASGQIFVHMDVDHQTLLLNLQPGQQYAEGRYDADEFYLENGVPVQKAPRPGPLAEFDYSAKTWTSKPDEEEAADALRLREAIKLRRDKAIDCGATIAGMPIGTDDKTQTRIVGAAFAAYMNPDYSVDWKMSDGTFVTLTGEQVIAAAQVVRAHVQKCFDREAELLSDLAQGIPYDIEAGWPEPPTPIA